jgi:rhodanese-related sulfurtransferase
MSPILRSISILLATASTVCAADKPIPNRLIDYPGFLKGAKEVAALREKNRVTEDEFLRMAKDPATIILDARSDAKYLLLHVRGAKHLSLPDITADELAKLIPDKQTRILIYCNNNFENAPVAFPGKAGTTSLNIYTFNTLHGYGYTNVYELGPLLDVRKTKVPLDGTSERSRP